MKGSLQSAVATFIIVAIPLSAAAAGYMWGQRNASQDVRTEWCQSLGGQASGDLCVKGNEVVLRWND